MRIHSIFMLCSVALTVAGCAIQAPPDPEPGAAGDVASADDVAPGEDAERTGTATEAVCSAFGLVSQRLDGFYTTPNTGLQQFAVWSSMFSQNQESYYCWAFDEGSREAIGITYFGNINAGYDSMSYEALTCNRPGGQFTFCPWPNGMVVRDNAVYLIGGSTIEGKGTVCHITTNEQVNHHGGWGVVWNPGLASNAMKFEYGVTNAGGYQASNPRIPACAW